MIAGDVPSILFVCLGNICRSPAAEGVFRAKAAAAGLEVVCDSAGTGPWHAGKKPDARMIAAARARGYNLSAQRARQVDDGDYYVYDLILAMDERNLADLTQRAPRDGTAKIAPLLSYGVGGEVPDPYHGGRQGFETVLDLIENACDGLIRTLKAGA